MTTNHIDQLTEWYESAERITKTNLPRSGDYVISPFFNGTGFHVELEPDDWPADIVREEREDARILARAPKPKPAWHDAVAVTAKGREDWDHTEAFSRNDDYDPPRWVDNQGITYTSDELTCVTPLIEAKVAAEMMKRAVDRAEALGYIERVFGEIDGLDQGAMASILTAALGLETE